MSIMYTNKIYVCNLAVNLIGAGAHLIASVHGDNGFHLKGCAAYYLAATLLL